MAAKVVPNVNYFRFASRSSHIKLQSTFQKFFIVTLLAGSSGLLPTLAQCSAIPSFLTKSVQPRSALFLSPDSNYPEPAPRFCSSCPYLSGIIIIIITSYYYHHHCVNGRWNLQVGSKEQQTSHSQRFLILFLLFFSSCPYLSGIIIVITSYYYHHHCVNGRWNLQVGSKEQQTSHSQRFLILFLLFFWMVHARGRCSSLSPSLALTYSDVS